MTPRHPGGRPRTVSSPAEFDFLVDWYEADLERIYRDDIQRWERVNKGAEKPLPPPSPPRPAIMSLVRWLGMNSKSSLTDYESRPEFSSSVQRARTMVQEGYEYLGRELKNPAMAIFVLKNSGDGEWKDEKSVNVRGYLATFGETELRQLFRILPTEYLTRINRGGEDPELVAADWAKQQGTSVRALLSSGEGGVGGAVGSAPAQPHEIVVEAPVERAPAESVGYAPAESEVSRAPAIPEAVVDAVVVERTSGAPGDEPETPDV